MKKIMVTDGGFKHTLGAVRALKKEGWTIYLLTDKDEPAYWSTSVDFRVDKKLFKPDYLGDLASYIKKESIEVFLPIGAESVKLLSDNRELFDCVRFAMPSKMAVNLALDKAETLDFCEALGVRTPRKITKTNFHEVVPNSQYVVKHKSEIIKERPRYISGAELLRRSEVIASDELVIQEYIEGIGVGFFAAYQNGKMVAHFMHRRVREYPATGGASSCAESIFSNDLYLIGKKILDKLDWHGVAMVEFKLTSDGRLVLMEINPKFWGSLDLAIYSGVNFPVITAQICLGKEIPPTKYDPGIRFQWFIEGELQHIAQKPSSVFEVLKDLISPSVGGNVCIRDIKPHLMKFKGALKRNMTGALTNFFPKFASFYTTLRRNGIAIAAKRLISELTGVQLRSITAIDVDIYIGSQFGRLGLMSVKNFGCSAILSLQSERDDKEYGVDHMSYLRIPVIEYTAPTIDQLKTGADFIDDALRRRNKIFIHCREGVSRAPLFAIAYLVRYRGMSIKEAESMISARRPFINILPVQRIQLEYLCAE